MHGIGEAMQKRMVELSEAMERDGVSPADQVAIYGGLMAVTLATMPAADARRSFMAHFEACRFILADPAIAAAGAIIRQARQ